MEGQSEDCPDMTQNPVDPSAQDERAAMEGQSGDCPDRP